MPVIIAINNACLGIACEMAAAGDIRYCTEDSIFEFKEVDVGLCADMGLM